MAEKSNGTPKSVSIGVTLVFIILPILIGGYFLATFMYEESAEADFASVQAEDGFVSEEIRVTAEQRTRVDIPLGKCIRWEGADPEGDAFSVSYLTDSGDLKVYTGGSPEMNAVVFTGNRGSQPVAVSYFLASVNSKWCSA